MPATVYPETLGRTELLSVAADDLTQYLHAVSHNNGRVAKVRDLLCPSQMNPLMQRAEGDSAIASLSAYAVDGCRYLGRRDVAARYG